MEKWLISRLASRIRAEPAFDADANTAPITVLSRSASL
jgi:hypothetical protein